MLSFRRLQLKSMDTKAVELLDEATASETARICGLP